MSASPLLVERDGSLTRLVLNRPDKANALNPGLVEALADAIDSAYRDGTTLLALRANGKHFCAGFDFSAFDDATEAELLWRFVRIEQLLQRLFHAPFATAAFAHGRNFGAGADLFIACDTRIATADATFRMPGLCFGLQLGTRRLAARIGDHAARTMLGASLTLDAENAHRIRFATALAPGAAWPDLEASHLQDAIALTSDARARLHRATTSDTRAADLADLVDSVTAPGIKERIRRYRAGA